MSRRLLIPRYPVGGGWHPTPPDARDLTMDHPEVRARLGARPRVLPRSVDLRRWCGSIRFQGGFPTCNAHAVAALLEYFEHRAFGTFVPPSVRFLFKVAKNFAQVDDTSPVYIRQIMGVLRMVGAPPEKYWPYPPVQRTKAGGYPSDDPELHEEPPAFCYAVAADYRAIRYYRLDARTRAGSARSRPKGLLDRVRRSLAMDTPTTLGFPLYANAITQSWTDRSGVISYPARGDREVGGHAVVAVGYDDRKRFMGGRGPTTSGALLIQNSWGPDWGEAGFGWLPYRYVLEGLTQDFWTLTRAEWTDTGQFQLGLARRIRRGK